MPMLALSTSVDGNFSSQSISTGNSLRSSDRMWRLRLLLLLVSIAVSFGSNSWAQTTYTLSMNDAATTVAGARRVGVNLEALTFYDTGQIYKNLVGADSFGFENTYLTQTWALAAAGTTTTFCGTNQYAVYPSNFFVGATVVSNEGATAGYSGTVTANTTGVGGSTAPCYTVSPAASTAFAAGDQVNIAFNQFPTAESCWEANDACGVWGDVGSGGKLLTDSTTNYSGDGGKQCLVLDVTAGTSATSQVVLYFESDASNHFVVLNGTYQGLPSENGPHRTLGLPHRSRFAFAELSGVAPLVVTGEVEVLPAERRQVLAELWVPKMPVER